MNAKKVLFGAALLLGLPGSGSGMTPSEEAEDSPLFAESRQKAFAQFASLDGLASRTANMPPLSGPAIGNIIVVEGTRWHTLTNEGSPVPAIGGSRNGPLPRDVTISDPTCGGASTCVPTSCVTPTCGGAPTCVPNSTCAPNYTCVPNSTCGYGYPTCYGAYTCYINYPTCLGYATCNSASPTCISPTCVGITCQPLTCNPAQCPTSLFGVTVPQPGVIQMSFRSSAGLTYTLLHCTNLTATNWLTAASVLGNGGTMTFSHTNNANLSFYRLLVSR